MAFGYDFVNILISAASKASCLIIIFYSFTNSEVSRSPIPGLCESDVPMRTAGVIRDQTRPDTTREMVRTKGEMLRTIGEMVKTTGLDGEDHQEDGQDHGGNGQDHGRDGEEHGGDSEDHQGRW